MGLDSRNIYFFSTENCIVGSNLSKICKQVPNFKFRRCPSLTSVQIESLRNSFVLFVKIRDLFKKKKIKIKNRNLLNWKKGISCCVTCASKGVELYTQFTTSQQLRTPSPVLRPKFTRSTQLTERENEWSGKKGR